MSKFIPYLSFNNNCREAMSFYKDCFGGELKMQTVGEMPEMAAQMPAHFKDAVLHAELISGERVMYGSDLSRNAITDGNSIRLCINCQGEDELNNLFTKLSAGGEVIHPIGDMPWGAKYAELTDKYGKIWVLNCQMQ